MRKQKTDPAQPLDLRREAETRLAQARVRDARERSDAELLHELQVHEIELEIQNENLRESQMAIEASRDRYVDFYDFAPVGYVTLDAQGEITEINLAGAEMLGKDRTKILGHYFNSFVVAEDLEQWHLFFLDAIRQDAKHTCEVGLRRAEEGCMEARLDVQRLQREDKPPILRMVLSDITARKTAEADLQRFFKLIPEPLCIASTDGYFVEVNPAWTAILGFSEAELLTTPVLELIHPDDREATRKEVARQIAGGAADGAPLFVNRYRCKDGGYRWLEWQSSPSQSRSLLFAAARDVTERKLSQAALREALRFQQSILDAVPLAVIATGLDGTISHFNAGAEHMFGYAALEMVGRQSVAMLHDPQELAAHAHAQALSGIPQTLNPQFAVLVDKALRGQINESEWTLVRKDGSRFVALVSSVALRDDNGHPAGFLGVALDITDRKRAEAQLRELTVHLEQQVDERTRQLRAVSAELAMTEERERRILAQDLHDNLGQLLAVLKIKLTSLQCGALQSSVDQIVDLVDQAEQSARMLTLELSPPILHTLGFVPALEWLVDEMYRIYGLKVGIDNDSCRKRLIPEIQAILYRAVRELLINAAKHSGAVEANLSCLCDRRRLMLVVSDDGRGFDPAEIGMVHAGQNHYGLSSIKERIANIGGVVEVDSSPGNGTTVSLNVPCSIVDKEICRDPSNSGR